MGGGNASPKEYGAPNREYHVEDDAKATVRDLKQAIEELNHKLVNQDNIIRMNEEEVKRLYTELSGAKKVIKTLAAMLP